MIDGAVGAGHRPLKDDGLKTAQGHQPICRPCLVTERVAPVVLPGGEELSAIRWSQVINGAKNRPTDLTA